MWYWTKARLSPCRASGAKAEEAASKKEAKAEPNAHMPARDLLTDLGMDTCVVHLCIPSVVSTTSNREHSCH